MRLVVNPNGTGSALKPVPVRRWLFGKTGTAEFRDEQPSGHPAPGFVGGRGNVAFAVLVEQGKEQVAPWAAPIAKRRFLARNLQH